MNSIKIPLFDVHRRTFRIRIYYRRQIENKSDFFLQKLCVVFERNISLIVRHIAKKCFHIFLNFHYQTYFCKNCMIVGWKQDCYYVLLWMNNTMYFTTILFCRRKNKLFLRRSLALNNNIFFEPGSTFILFSNSHWK